MNLDRHLLAKLDALLCALGSVTMLSLLVFYYPSSGEKKYTRSENTFEGLFVAVEHVPEPSQSKSEAAPPTFRFMVDGKKQTEDAQDEWIHSAPGKAVMIKRRADSFPKIAVLCDAQSPSVSCRVTVSYNGEVATLLPEHTTVHSSVPFFILQPGQ